MNKILRIITLAIATALIFTVTAAASSYIYDDYGNSNPAPDTYKVEQILTGSSIGAGELKAPQDIFVSDSNVYLADTENNRVLVLDTDFRLQKEIAVLNNTAITTFSKPMGIHRDQDGFLYICDSGNSRVVKIDENQNVITEYTKPDTQVLAEDFVYQPYKVSVDSAGGVYVVAYGLYQGLIYYQNDGAFVSFYGSSKVEVTVAVIAENIWKSLFTKEQRESLSRTIPTEYSNVFIDEKNFIYTSILQTKSSVDEARKLNALGNNVIRYSGFNTYYPKNNYGDIEVEWHRGNQIDNKFVDIYVDEDGIITLLDQERCRVFEYNEENDLLLTYGGKGDRQGLFLKPTSISKVGDKLVVVDAEKNSLTVLSPTDYTVQLKDMSRLYSQGKYEKTIEGFGQILRQNSNLSLAYKSMGKAYLQQGKYEDALDYLKKANDRQGYSDALKEYRKVFVRDHIIVLLLGSVVVVLLVWFLLKKFRKWLLYGKDELV